MKDFLSAIKPEYILIIGGSLIVIISFIFNFIAKKTHVPSVLLLMLLGVGMQFAFPDLKANPLISKTLIIVGKIGVILIVLEAALDLKLQKDKITLILRSLLVALFGLIGTSCLIAYLLQELYLIDFYRGLVYAVPLAILSSAIIIPSVKTLPTRQKEFLIYESTLSDIFGIIFFQFLIEPNTFESASDVVLGVSANIGVTLLVAILFSYLVVWGFSKLKSSVKLFLIISVLTLAYGIGSVFHLSSLIIILFFGLILGNVKVFFRGYIKNFVDSEKLKPVFHEFHIITLESAFFLRTFFFVMFGLTITLGALVDLSVAIESLLIILVIYLVRLILLKLILWNRSINPKLWIAPRGLITVLLFYSIPTAYAVPEFNQGIILYTILVSSVIMTFALIRANGRKIRDVIINDLNLNYLEDGIEREMLEEEIKYHESELKQDRELFNEDNDVV